MKVTGKGQIYFVFLSTLSVRRATEGDILTQAEILAFLSTLSVRRATLSFAPYTPASSISIHALREESDRSLDVDCHKRAGFLSTLSVRRATVQQQPGSVI